MNKEVDIAEIISVIEEQILAGGTVIFTPKGNSMRPMLKDNRDKVYIEGLSRPLQKNDIVLYKRKNDKYVLHRIISINKNKTFNLRGDNQVLLEKQVKYEQIIGVVKQFERDGKLIDVKNKLYILYCLVWKNTVWFRKQYVIVRKIYRKVKMKLTR